MQLSNYGNAAQVIGVQHTQSFQMQMNAKMFSILTDKLYQNKEGAVIRELSANARDAHVAAGKANLPFDITLPSWVSNIFTIRDYGTGIDPDEFYDIYTNLGHSTKDHEDLSIGAYGLGSKTPFAITDQYTIRNFWNGSVYVYTAFKDEGMPTVSLIGSELTDECNGLEITVDITKNGSVGSFRRECAKQLAYFDVKPNVSGYDEFEWDDIPELHMGYDIKSGHYYSDITIVMGGIPYTSSTSNFPDDVRESLKRLELTLVAKLGEVDIPPSRESLEFTPKSIKFVTDKLNEIKDDYIHDFAYRVEQAANEVELVHVLKNRITEWIGIKDFETNLYSYKDNMLTGVQLVDITDGQIGGITVKEHRSYYKTLRPTYNGNSIANILRGINSRSYNNNDDIGKVYLNDLSPRANKVIQMHKDALDMNSSVVFPTEGKSKLFQDAANKIEIRLKNMGFNPIRLSTLMTMPVVIKSSSSKVFNKPDQVFLIDQRGEVIKRSLKILPDEGYFTTMSNWTLRSEKSYLASLTSVLGLEIYALRSYAQMAVAKSAAYKSGKWVSVHNLEDKLIKGLGAKLKKANDAEAKYDEIKKVLNCSPLFSKQFNDIINHETKGYLCKLKKLSNACNLIQVEFDESRLTMSESYMISTKDIKVPTSKAKVNTSVMKLAKHAEDNYAEALTTTFHDRSWDKERKSLKQTINLIVGNFK